MSKVYYHDLEELLVFQELTEETDRLRAELAALREENKRLEMIARRVAPAYTCECPDFCLWHERKTRERFAALRDAAKPFADDEWMTSVLGEAFHTAFRKAVDSRAASVIWNQIRLMDTREWHAVLDFVLACMRQDQEKLRAALAEGED